MEKAINEGVEVSERVEEHAQETPKKFNSIDLCKFIMAICVVAIHTRPWLDFFTDGVMYDIAQQIVLLAVPFFFLSSAYFLFKKMVVAGNGDIRSAESLSVLKIYCLKMLKLYFIWQLIYLPSGIYQIVLSVKGGHGVFEEIFRYIKDMVFFVASWDSLHLWYLWASCITSFVFYLMLKLKFKNWLIIVLSFAIYFFGRGLRMFVGMSSQFDGVLLTMTQVVNWVFGADYLVRGFLYFPVALLLVLKPIKNLRWYIILPIFLVIFSSIVAIPNLVKSSLINTVVEEIVPAIASYLFFMLILSINLKDSKVYFYLRKYSMVIYLVHNFIVFLLRITFLGQGIIMFTIVTVVSILIAMLVIYFSEKKKVKWLKAILT